MLAAANAGATEDVRANQFWPTLKAMLARTKAPNAQAAQMLAVLDKWHGEGGSRVDSDLDGKADSPGVPIIDAAWKGISSAGMCDRLGAKLCKQLEGLISRYDTPPGGQYSGWHQYMWKDMRTMLGKKVRGPYSTRYCGKGSVKRCSKELWAALAAAGKQLAATQGADPTTWRSPTTHDRVRARPALHDAVHEPAQRHPPGHDVRAVASSRRATSRSMSSRTFGSCAPAAPTLRSTAKNGTALIRWWRRAARPGGRRP